MSGNKPSSPLQDDLVHQLVLADEQLSRDGAELRLDSTAAPDETVDPQVTDCLQLLDRVRRASAIWPGSFDNLQWLYFDHLAPRHIGRFQIQRRLGMGGFGIVFLARDPDLDRDIALKVPRLESMISPESRQRFLRESRLAAGLAHENIAAVFEAGICEPVTYIASAYCPGGSMAVLLREHGRFPPQTAARLMVAISQAVQHAHNRGVLHRDIKPSNILVDAPREDASLMLLSPERLARAARLVDFGLARSLEGEGIASEPPGEATRTGVMVGTPAYMAPEQVIGQRDQVTEAADIYGLGATLYCLLTGAPPFRRETDWETLQALQRDEALAPSRQADGISSDLDAICLKCLDKDPTSRYRSAGELERDLCRYLGGEPTLARPLNGFQRLIRWTRRQPALAGSLTVLALVLVMATALSTLLWRRSVASERLAMAQQASAEASAEEAREQARHARQAADQLLTAIADEPSIRSEGLEPFRQRLLSTANAFYRQLREQRPTDATVVAELIETTCRLATIHRLLGDHQRAVELWRDATHEARQSTPQETSRLAFLLGSQAQELSAVGNQAAAVELSREALALQRHACELDHSKDARTKLVQLLVNDAQLLMTDGGHEPANEVLDEAIAVVNTMTGHDPAQWPACKLWGIVLRDKARALAGLARHSESSDTANLALRIIDEHMQRVPADRSACMMHEAALRKTLGYNQLSTGDLSAAEREYREALDLAEALVAQHPHVGMLHEYVADASYQLAKVQWQCGKKEAARKLLAANLSRIEAGQTRYPDLQTQWDQRCQETQALLDEIEEDESAQDLPPRFPLDLLMHRRAASSPQRTRPLTRPVGRVSTSINRQALATSTTNRGR